MKERVIDSHIHICKEDWRFGADLVFGWGDLDDLFRKGSIQGAVVMPMMSNTDDSVSVNTTFLDEVRKFPHKLKMWPYYWPHPGQVDTELASQQEFAGVKFHPSISQKRIDNAPDVIAIARDRGLPLLVHCGRNQISHIDYLLTAVRMEAGVTYVGAHLGGLANELILAALALIEKQPRRDNLYLDTSGCMNPKIVRRAVQVMGSDRVLWGTDLPFFDPEVSRVVLDRAGLEGPDLRKILYDNAVEVHKKK